MVEVNAIAEKNLAPLKSEGFSVQYQYAEEKAKLPAVTYYELIDQESFRADVQPYNGGLAEKEYGQVGEVSLRIFCEPNRKMLEIVNIAKIGNEYYTAHIPSIGSRGVWHF